MLPQLSAQAAVHGKNKTDLTEAEHRDIESKNSEMKRFHGLGRAIGYGLRSVLLQAMFTAIAVDLKRMVALKG